MWFPNGIINSGVLQVMRISGVEEVDLSYKVNARTFGTSDAKSQVDLYTAVCIRVKYAIDDTYN